MAIASAIDTVVFTLLVSIGALSFGKILLTLLVKIVIVATVCLLLGYFEKFLNRKVDKKPEEKKEEVEKQPEAEVNQTEEKPEEKKDAEEEVKISAPDDID